MISIIEGAEQQGTICTLLSDGKRDELNIMFVPVMSPLGRERKREKERTTENEREI